MSKGDWKYVERYDTHVRWRENPDTAFGIDLEMQGIGGGWFSISAAHLWFLLGRASTVVDAVKPLPWDDLCWCLRGMGDPHDPDCPHAAESAE